ncbi:MAG: helix-turn-helix domain-containing protein [Clostridiales bacterium]|nr:helix-turn-helix domain-containing protein [Clostridiales bacterium]
MENTTVAARLKSARLAKNMKQSEVAGKIGCAATSLTNWETGKVNPSMEILSQLCAIYQIQATSLLSKEFTYEDLLDVAAKPVPKRSYEEQIALNFSYNILARKASSEELRKQADYISEISAFVRRTDLLERAGGDLRDGEIAPLLDDYKANGSVDEDILLAYHMMDTSAKQMMLSFLIGCLNSGYGLQNIFDNAKPICDYTAGRFSAEQGRLVSGNGEG